MNRTTEIDNYLAEGRDDEDIITNIMFYGIQWLVHALGTYIQYKVILMCIKERHITWKIDIIHAGGMIITFLSSTLFDIISDYVPDLYQYTNVSICYIFGIASLYGIYQVQFHSLTISFMKYIFVVHQRRNMLFGKEKTSKIFFYVTLILPLLLSISTVLAFDFESIESLISCFGLKEELSIRYNTSTALIERMFLCKMSGNLEENESTSYLFLFKQVFCALKMILTLALASNLAEGYFYFKIFKLMRR